MAFVRPQDDGPSVPATGTRAAWLDRLQVAVTLAVLVPCCRGAANPFLWLLVPIVLALLRVLVSRSDRQRARAAWRRLWATLEAFPGPGRGLPWRATFALVVAPTALLCLVRDGIQTGDSRPVVLTAARLVNHHDWDLREQAEAYAAIGFFTPPESPHPYFVRPVGDRLVSSYPAGMLPFALPVVAVARALGADLDDVGTHDRLEKWTAAWVAGACVGAFFLIGLHLVAPRDALLACALLAAGSVVYSTVGQALWQHGGVILWCLIALLVEVRRPRPGPAGTALQGLALAMMLACRLSAVLIIVPFGAWVLLRSPRRAVALTACALIAYAPWAALHLALYGAPFGPSMGQLHGGHWSAGSWHSWAGVLVSPSRGLLVYQPWLLLGLFAAAAAVRRTETRSPLPVGWQAFCVTAIGLHLAMVSTWTCWWGGACWGSRLAAEAVPLAALLCLRPLAALAAAPRGRCLVAALLLVSGLMHLPAPFLRSFHWNGHFKCDTHREVLWSWSRPPFLYPLVGGERRR